MCLCHARVLSWTSQEYHHVLLVRRVIEGGSKTSRLKEVFQSSVYRNIPGFHRKESQQGWLACFSRLRALLTRIFPCRENRNVYSSYAILTCASQDSMNWPEGAEIWMGPNNITQQMVFMWRPRISKCTRDWDCLRFWLSNSRYLMWFHEGGQVFLGRQRRKVKPEQGPWKQLSQRSQFFVESSHFFYCFFALFNSACICVYVLNYVKSQQFH